MAQLQMLNNFLRGYMDMLMNQATMAGYFGYSLSFLEEAIKLIVSSDLCSKSCVQCAKIMNRTVNCDVNRRIKATWWSYIQNIKHWIFSQMAMIWFLNTFFNKFELNLKQIPPFLMSHICFLFWSKKMIFFSFPSSSLSWEY